MSERDIFQAAEAKRLFRVLASLRSPEDCSLFLEDLCTIKEIRDMANRLEAARMLEEGTNYLTVSKKTGMSTATISRVNRCLHYGKDGYRKALSLLRDDGKGDGKQ